MIDLSKITYRVVVMDETGRQYNIKNYIENLGWEENENEISVRSSFTARNDETSKGYLSSIIKPGCLVGIFATDGGSMDQEVARGYVEDWNPVQQSGGTTLKCTNYDELYKLQKSQENLYFPSGTGTQAAIMGILDDHEIPQDDYQGPNAAHGKQKFNNSFLSDIILELLDDAVKKGEERCIIRAAEGRTAILPKGSNKTVYVFKTDNTKSVSESMTTANLVTRVKVIGQADDDGKSSVEAVLNGLTNYGIRQRIYTRGADESLNDAMSASQEILNEKGNIDRQISVQSPDVPFIRKGDLVYLMAGTSEGYFFVKGIQHDADTYSMTMNLEITEQESVTSSGNSNGSTGETSRNSHEVGDIVNFHGGTHYVSSYPDAKGYGARAGKAKITKKNGAGGAHPWHLIHVDSGSNVYGWVDNGTFD
ncbi:hypothetical protein [Candidatus Merdisoma sp. JLR.KK006]|uniref:XkdQ/YqbQ family protein n=1 Tax=Candidatus Merdisoma sp. JLR.KK006 TaxID=3112626 RepID=UPI002FF1A371